MKPRIIRQIEARLNAFAGRAKNKKAYNSGIYVQVNFQSFRLLQVLIPKYGKHRKQSDKNKN